MMFNYNSYNTNYYYRRKRVRYYIKMKLVQLRNPLHYLNQRYYKSRCGAGLVPREDCRRRVRRKCSDPPVLLFTLIWPI